jgi:2'-5' RNA ligase
MTVRAFVALDIPAPTRARIASLLETLRPGVPGVRWLAPDSIHLTLRFLGEAGSAQLSALRPRLAEAAAAAGRSPAVVRGLGTFPERGRPKVLWLGTELPEGLIALQRACERAAVDSGFAAETRPFRSHITLGRWLLGPAARRPTLPETDLGPVCFESVVLYKSDLTPAGAVHEALHRFLLR